MRYILTVLALLTLGACSCLPGFFVQRDMSDTVRGPNEASSDSSPADPGPADPGEPSDPGDPGEDGEDGGENGDESEGPDDHD